VVGPPGLPAGNVQPGRSGHVPRAVVVHTTDGTFEGTLAWFHEPASGVSAHHVVGLDGRVVEVVPEQDTARHAGHDPRPELAVLGEDPPNLVTIGIEFDDGGDPHHVERPDAQYRAGALLLADIAERWGIPLDRDHVLPHRLINRDKTCPGNLDLDRLIDEAVGYLTPVTGDGDPGPAPRLVVLLPARNAAADLPDWLAGVERFADAVVALDDGSTDDTAAILAAHPLVEVLLRNPRRETYAGWDDGANRNRLLAAAAELVPAWVLSLDADERVPPDDAEALRRFLATDALPGVAYGLQCFRMWGDGCDPEPRTVYRLFSVAPGQRFPDDQLHFDPVPTDIPRDRHVRTSLRIQHWGSADERLRSARVAKYRQADPGTRYPTNHGGLDEVPARVEPWRARPDDRPVLLGARPRSSPPSSSPKLVVLLPARNAAADLPDWFAGVERFADAVVALDDGSTDDTAAILGGHPLVRVLLHNPRRETYEGWDDSGNRNRLLAAAAALEPDWILSLDADERIPADDAEALRRFLATDALPGLAYGMRCYRMVGDLGHYDRAGLWVYRLFPFRPGQAFPTSRLHFVPVPTSIPRDRWLRTTIRIQHVASLTADRRAARFAKYREADPDVEYQDGYDHLLDAPVDVVAFPARPPDLPVLADETDAAPGPSPWPASFDPHAPVLSAIVISRDDEDRIGRAVGSVVGQRCHEPFEVIVVTSGTDRTAAVVRERFPGVRVVELDHPALPGEARNAGLRFARGDYVSFPGSHVELPPGSLAARIRAHDQGWTMVTGTTGNGNHSMVGWAAYFLDQSTVLPGRPSGQLGHPPAHCSYEAEALRRAGGFPDDVRAGEDTAVNDRLFRSGATAYRAADVPLVHHNRSRTVRHLVRHHYERGRAQVQFFRARGPGPRAERRSRDFLWAYPTRRLARIDGNVLAWGGELAPRYRRVRPLVRLGVLAAWFGAHVELRRPSRPTASPTPTDGDVSSPTGVVTPLTRPLRVRREGTGALAGARALFLHIPKTAGSTLLRILEREYEGSPQLRLYRPLEGPAALVRAVADLPEAERRAFRLVAGHMAFGIHALLPGPSTYVTLLRDPVDRVVSHYHYTRSRPDDPGHARALEGVRSLEDYVHRSPYARLVNDGQTRLLGFRLEVGPVVPDREALARAKDVLDRDDVVVGLQDRFDESLLLMVRAFGWGYPAVIDDNVGRDRPRLEDLAPSTVELIREHNALDVELYEHARRRVERDLASVPDLSDELATLRLAARWWAPASGS
jgi:glycosyltransferase involved in cell wall biosynthesis